MTPQDRDNIIRTVIGEADDQSDLGRAAVAHVILNRVQKGEWGDNPTSVVLARGQFEPWKTKPKELRAIDPTSRRYMRNAAVVDGVLSGDIPDPTGGATHFLDPVEVRRRRRGTLPDWAQGNPTAVIGDHAFHAPDGPVVRVAQAPGRTQSDADILQLYGLNPSNKGAPASAPAAAAPAAVQLDPDAQKIAEQYGVTLGGVPIQKNVPAEIKNPPLGENKEAERLAGFGTSAAHSIPIVGPTLEAAGSAGAAALQPLTRGDEGMTFGERFERNQSLSRMADEYYAKNFPGRSVAANVLGSAIGYGGLSRTIPGRMAMGMPTPYTPGFAGQFYGGTLGGAGINSLDAAIRGDNIGTGALIGAGGGAIAPVLGTVGRYLGNQLATWGLGPTPAALSDLNATGRGWISDAMRYGATDPVGEHGFLGEINPALTDILKGIAAGSGRDADIVRGAYGRRAAQAFGRIEGYVTDALGPRRNIVDYERFLTEARAAAADPLYEQWRSMQVHPTPELKALYPTLDELGLFDTARRHALMRNVPFDRTFFTPGPQKSYPTTESWDMVKRAIDARVDSAYASGNKTEAADLLTLKGRLLRAIDGTPAGQVWRQARQEFADRSALIDQVAAGRDTFLGGRSGLTVDELREELRHLSHPEMLARMQGMREAISESMGESLRGGNAMRDKLLAPNNRAKLLMMMRNDPRAQQLLDRLEAERTIGGPSEGKYQQVVGGSPTVPKREAHDRLHPPPMEDFWNPSANSLWSWVPGMQQLIHAVQPTTAINDARQQAWAAAREEAARLLTLPRGSQRAGAVEAALRAEALRRGTMAHRGEVTGAAAAALMAPTEQTLRLNMPPNVSPGSVVRRAE